MEDEITKHAKKIYHSAKEQGTTLGGKIKDIFIEIFIIVFAVTLSIYLHAWSEHRQQQKEVREFLADLKEDISNDISGLQNSRDGLIKVRENILFLLSIGQKNIDSILEAKGSLAISSNIGTTKINNGDYEGFKSSGKIGLIENKNLKKLILKYYQSNYQDVLEAEKINASEVVRISEFWAENAEKNFKQILLSPRLKSMMNMFQNTAKGNIDLYQDAIDSAKKIIAEIGKQSND